jgi:hypothetical protein
MPKPKDTSKAPSETAALAEKVADLALMLRDGYWPFGAITLRDEIALDLDRIMQRIVQARRERTAKVWTLTVEARGYGIETTVHQTRAAAEQHFRDEYWAGPLEPCADLGCHGDCGKHDLPEPHDADYPENIEDHSIEEHDVPWLVSVTGPPFRVLDVNNEEVARYDTEAEAERAADRGDHGWHVVAGG